MNIMNVRRRESITRLITEQIVIGRQSERFWVSPPLKMRIVLALLRHSGDFPIFSTRVAIFYMISATVSFLMTLTRTWSGPRAVSTPVLRVVCNIYSLVIFSSNVSSDVMRSQSLIC